VSEGRSDMVKKAWEREAREDPFAIMGHGPAGAMATSVCEVCEGVGCLCLRIDVVECE